MTSTTLPSSAEVSGRSLISTSTRTTPHRLIQKYLHERQISAYPTKQWLRLRDRLILPRHTAHQQHLAYSNSNNIDAARRHLPGQLYDDDILSEENESRIYFGQFIQQGELFYCGRQDFSVSIFHSTLGDRRSSEWPLLGRWYASTGRWTLTDAAFSERCRLLAFTSIAPVCHLIRVPEATDDCGAQTSIQPWQSQQYQYSIDLHSDNNGDGGGEEQHEFGVWSVDFSAGGDQLAAGTSEGGLLVRRLTDDGRFLDTCKISKAHLADINSVKWLNDSLILTASDDSLIHLWDLRVARRTSSKPCGSLIGHTEGITSIDYRVADGWSCVSAGKDQQLKLWDLRRLTPANAHQAIPASAYGLNIPNFDYRFMPHPHSAQQRQPLPPSNCIHPHDNSIGSLYGPQILRTLIRCRYSPTQQWIYCGSADGTVWLFDWRTAGSGSVHGRRLGPVPVSDDDHPISYYYGMVGGDYAVIRDSSWHPHLPLIVASSWTGKLFRFDFT